VIHLEPNAESLGSELELPIKELKLSLSPRHQLQDLSYARTLTEILPRLPPIVVHAPSRQVIDGAHRILAARLRDQTTIRARLFFGTDSEAFVQAVRRNVAHGKPLTLAEREAAAAKIVRLNPAWSDRRIAETCGLSPMTVARVRSRSTDRNGQLSARVGRDGKSRPTDPVEARHRIADAIKANPNASMREIARQTGASQGTVRDVRARLQRGEEVLSPRLARAHNRKQEVREPSRGQPRTAAAYRVASEFVDWFERHRLRADTDWERWVDGVPLSRVYEVADVARECGESWLRFASALELRVRRRRESRRGT
jgi:transposase